MRGRIALWSAFGLAILLGIGLFVPTLRTDGSGGLTGEEAAFAEYALVEVNEFYTGFENIIVRKILLNSVEAVPPGESIGIVIEDGELVEGFAPGAGFECTGPPYDVTGYYRAQVSAISIFGFKYADAIVTCGSVTSG